MSNYGLNPQRTSLRVYVGLVAIAIWLALLVIDLCSRTWYSVGWDVAMATLLVVVLHKRFLQDWHTMRQRKSKKSTSES